MAVVHWPLIPRRAIVVKRIAPGSFIASFAGDEWSPPWRTEAGSAALVWDAIRHRGTRLGLPILPPTPILPR